MERRRKWQVRSSRERLISFSRREARRRIVPSGATRVEMDWEATLSIWQYWPFRHDERRVSQMSNRATKPLRLVSEAKGTEEVEEMEARAQEQVPASKVYNNIGAAEQGRGVSPTRRPRRDKALPSLVRANGVGARVWSRQVEGR